VRVAPAQPMGGPGGSGAVAGEAQPARGEEARELGGVDVPERVVRVLRLQGGDDPRDSVVGGGGTTNTPAAVLK
jgi:hypothetical protein